MYRPCAMPLYIVIVNKSLCRVSHPANLAVVLSVVFKGKLEMKGKAYCNAVSICQAGED